uniref:Uncharacterized protein n=1 Tax=Panagrolaimus sp. ES5 TaxID=591445 RepID=A0AC34FC97_9BILA
MKCAANDPNLIEMYYAVKILNNPKDKFYLFKDNYYEDFSIIHEQTELNIVAIKLEKNQIFDKPIPDIISPTLQPKYINFNEYGIYIFTFIFLSFIIIFVGCWASKDLSKWYAIKEEEEEEKQQNGKKSSVEMITYASTSILEP